jgi:hypothetical protein
MSGQQLLAHELAHVVQQDTSGLISRKPLTVGLANSLVKREVKPIADAAAFGAPLSAVSRISGVLLQRSAISNDERFLNLDSCAEMACGDEFSCPDDKDGIKCPEGTENAFTKKKHKFTRHLRCDPECRKGITPCSDSDKVLALPKKRFNIHKCNQMLTLCAHGKSTTVPVRERSNKNSWEASPSVSTELGAPRDFHASIYPEPNDPDMKNDRKCTPAPSKEKSKDVP